MAAFRLLNRRPDLPPFILTVMDPVQVEKLRENPQYEEIVCENEDQECESPT